MKSKFIKAAVVFIIGIAFIQTSDAHELNYRHHRCERGYYAPRAYYYHPVWIRPHWELNRCGHPVWVQGYWR